MYADRARILYLVGRHGGYSAALGLLAWLAERTGRPAPQVAGDPFPTLDAALRDWLTPEQRAQLRTWCERRAGEHRGLVPVRRRAA